MRRTVRSFLNTAKGANDVASVFASIKNRRLSAAIFFTRLQWSSHARSIVVGMAFIIHGSWSPSVWTYVPYPRCCPVLASQRNGAAESEWNWVGSSTEMHEGFLFSIPQVQWAEPSNYLCAAGTRRQQGRGETIIRYHCAIDSDILSGARAPPFSLRKLPILHSLSQ